jgi:hypothetical protein
MKIESFRHRLQLLCDRINLGMDCRVVIGKDEEFFDAQGNPDGRFYFQIQCYRRDVISGEMGYGFGGKAYLSEHMTDSEMVQIVFGLYKGYWEHEARETFTYRGRRPFGPHISTEALWEVAKRVDVRSARHVEDRANLTIDTTDKVSSGGPDDPDARWTAAGPTPDYLAQHVKAVTAVCGRVNPRTGWVCDLLPDHPWPFTEGRHRTLINGLTYDWFEDERDS